MSVVSFNFFKPVAEQPQDGFKEFGLPRAYISSQLFLEIFGKQNQAGAADFHLVDKDIWNLNEAVQQLYYDKEKSVSFTTTVLMGLIVVAMVTTTIAIVLLCNFPALPVVIFCMTILSGIFIFVFYLCLKDRITLYNKIKVFDQKLVQLQQFVTKHGEMLENAIVSKLNSPEKNPRGDQKALDNIKAFRKLFKC